MTPADAVTPVEADRLTTLGRFRHLREERSPAFVHISRIATEHFRVPMAFVSLIDEDEQWFAGSQGLSLSCTRREDAFCAHTILSDEVTIVEDAYRDTRFRDNPLVTGEPHIRFYAGAPLIFADGIRLGSVCIADRVPRTLNTGQRIVLRNLAEIAMAEMKLRDVTKAT